jgi:ribonuclease HII
VAAVAQQRHPGFTPRRDTGLACYERVLARAGLAPVAGIDEAGRGACAGPLVVAAVVLDPRRMSRLAGLADSKALTAPAREDMYDHVVASALAWHAVVIPSADIDAIGLHVCNVTGMRRAVAGLACRPGYVLTDGFPVRGLAVPALAMWQGDEVAACVAAASVVAKVTRDRIMKSLHLDYPEYGFARHKGYSTPSHMTALAAHGPCPQHRMSFANVIGVVRALGGGPAEPLPAEPLAEAPGLDGRGPLAEAQDPGGAEPFAAAADIDSPEPPGEAPGMKAELAYG